MDFSTPVVPKQQRVEEVPFGEIFFQKESLTLPKRTKGKCWTLRDFSTSIPSDPLRRERLRKQIPKLKSHHAKKFKGDALVSPGTVCYAEKLEKLFWFRSLGQMVHFDAISFRRTFLDIFWSVLVDLKKKESLYQ